MASIHFDDVGKVFPDGTVALEELDLHVEDGEFVVLVGPSGSGKSTALRILAGLEDATSGAVRIGERVVNDVEPKDRDIAMVFQSYALYPHMSVQDNIGFPLRMRKEEKTSIRESVGRTAGRLNIGALLERRPRQLSGGQRQRVALGRAIVRDPQAFLMDEPLSNLDAKLRVEMRAYVAQLHQRLAKTIVYVTHDQVEAMTMGDRVAIMRDGRLEQVDAPQALYDRPASLFVAAFIGSPAMNLLRGRLVAEDGTRVVLHMGSARLALPDDLLRARPELMRRAGEEVVVGIRPEALRPAGNARDGLEGEVALVESLGSDLLAHLEVDAPAVLAGEQLEAARELLGGGANGTPPQAARLTARLEPSVAVRPGERLRLSVEPVRVHFFDPHTEQALV
ncbi:MAG TPA: ABC transporter ATP-binding protein [Thermoleophilaceae bacterium]|nr:ABC transporter ATP-binding protein [Thermoleophilaceae bacterium]